MSQHPADWVERLTAALDVARRAAIMEPHNPMWPAQARIIEVDLAEAVRRDLERLEIEANDRANNPAWGGHEIDFHSGRASAFREAASLIGASSEQRPMYGPGDETTPLARMLSGGLELTLAQLAAVDGVVAAVEEASDAAQG